MVVSFATSVVPAGENVAELPELVRRVGDDFHVFAQQLHSVDRHSDWPSAEAQETPEIHHDHDLTVAIANKTTDAAKHILTFDGTEDFPAKEIADTDGLRESHRGGLRQAHTRRRRHTP